MTRLKMISKMTVMHLCTIPYEYLKYNYGKKNEQIFFLYIIVNFFRKDCFCYQVYIVDNYV